MNRAKQKGVILMSSLVIAFIMTLWVVAELYRNSMTSSAVVFNYRKSEAHYLAKAAVSRSLARVNADPSWLATHHSKSSGDTTTPGAISWAEATGANTVLKAEATVESQVTTLSVPLKELKENETHLYSITPSKSGGPDLIAWKTSSALTWETLPPVPDIQSVTAVTGDGNGDVFCVGVGADGKSTVWRYRVGRGWRDMPNPPADTTLRSLSVGASTTLISLGEDDLSGERTMLHLDLKGHHEWTEVNAPTGFDIAEIAIPATSSSEAFAATANESTSKMGIHKYNFSSNSWTSVATAPTAAHINPADGLYTLSGEVPNFDAGIGVDPAGNIYAGSNPAGEPSVIYRLATDGSWTVLPGVKTYHWDGSSAPVLDSDTYALELKNLSVDDDGMVWVQWQGSTPEKFSTLFVDTSSL